MIASALLLLAAAPATTAADPAYVVMGADGGAVARVLTAAPACPSLTVDGKSLGMTERVAPETLPARPNKAGLTLAQPFPSRVCETALPRTARHAALGASALPLPKARIDRVVLIGDTGCRLKDADKQWQGCDSAEEWPFAAIAARAAALHPDLVLHVGDYLYRENDCPIGQSTCAGVHGGYDEANWRADFLSPAAPLLAAAPWVPVRGNHEECARAGLGWWRFVDPRPLAPGRDCRDPAADADTDHAAPYAVDLGGGTRVVVGDVVGVANPDSLTPARLDAYRAEYAEMARLARESRFGLIATHYPFNPVAWGKHGDEKVVIGGKPTKVFEPFDLKGVRATISGHVHQFQVARFADRPPQIITGFSGTQEDASPAPATLALAKGKPGADPLTALTTIQGVFGYALMTRQGAHWRLEAFDRDSKRIYTGTI